MYDFILQTSIVISLAGMIYLVARAIARMNDETELASDFNYFDHWLANFPITKIDAWFSLVMAKFLRRLRIIVLKFDNLLHNKLTTFKQKHNNNLINSNLVDDLNKKEDEI